MTVIPDMIITDAKSRAKRLTGAFLAGGGEALYLALHSLNAAIAV